MRFLFDGSCGTLLFMNTTMRNRLIGLVIVLVVLFLLSWLIPRHQSARDEHAVPVSAIPVGTASVAAASSAMKPAQATAASGVTSGGMTSAEDDGIHTQPYQSAEPAASTTGNGNTQASAAQAASQYATAAAPTQAEAPQSHPKPRTKASAAAPQSHPKPRTKIPAVTSYPASRGDAYVQIGSYGEMANAQKMLSSLKQKGFRGRIDTVAVKSKTFYRVRVGPYVDKNAATKAQRQLTAKGHKGTQVVSGS